MERNVCLTARELISEVKKGTGLNTYEAAVLIEQMIISEASPISSLYSFAGNAMWDTVKSMLADQLIEALGYGAHKKGLIASLVRNWVESIEWTQIKRYFGAWDEGGCELWVKSLLDTIVEGVAEYILNKVISSLKSEIDKGEIPKGGESGGTLGIDMSGVSTAFSEFLGGLTVQNVKSIMGNYVREQVFDQLFPEELRDDVVAKICDAMSDFSISDIGTDTFSSLTSKMSSMLGLDGE